ncbi:hypothetical protein ACH5RR_039044 [Cinchona calisaya]|uniref:CTLH domain-containing protein n=1 Tax=Cinchona calisaya TaxID=153742 RepID=A0ABD2XYV3_9GENT
MDVEDLLLSIRQFLAELDEGKYRETLHKLEKESGLFFDIKYFEECVMKGDWEEVEKYLSGFTKLEENPESKESFFEIRKQMFYEALYKDDHEKAEGILERDLKVFDDSYANDYNDLQLLLTLDNPREHEKLSKLEDEKAARELLVVELKRLIKANEILRHKLEFPSFQKSRLQTLVNQRQATAVSVSSPVTDSLMRSMPEFSGSPPAGDVLSLSDVKPMISHEVQKSNIWKLKEIKEPSELRSLRFPNFVPPPKIARLIYTNCGCSILSLRYDGVHDFWEWPKSEKNLNGKATTAFMPILGRPSSINSMTTDIRETNSEEAVPYLALSMTDFVISALGETISLFNLSNFKKLATIMIDPPHAATCLAFYPADYNLIAIGLEEGTIWFYDVHANEVKWECRGHKNRVTGLAFSTFLNVMVSSGANAQVRVWVMEEDCFKLQTNKFLKISPGDAPNPLADTHLQMHPNQTDVLFVHERLIAVYEASRLHLNCEWVPEEPSTSVTDAKYSGDGRLIYASFLDGSISVFTASALKLMCRINSTAYFPSRRSSGPVHPVVIAAHPSESNQFAVGLNNGSVYVFEPLQSEATWGSATPDDDNDGGVHVLEPLESEVTRGSIAPPDDDNDSGVHVLERLESEATRGSIASPDDDNDDAG